MSITALIWLSAFLILTGLTFRRSSWGIPLYALTYWAFPRLWWWGGGLLTSSGIRWNLTASLIFAAGVFLDKRPRPPHADRAKRQVLFLVLLYVLNAAMVSLLLAPDSEHSWEGFDGVWKQGLLLLLILAAIKDRFDLKVLIYSILIGATYIGYEVVFNDEGHYIDGRLEGIGIPGAKGANALGAIQCIAIPLGGYLLFCGKRIEKCVALFSLALILEVVLRCGSRGVFLGLIGGAVWLLLGAKGKLRKYAIAGVGLAIIAAFFQMGDLHQTRVLDRFGTTFASAEERDASAAGRIDYWILGMKMVGDHPLGSGFEAAFETDLGLSYLRTIGVEGTHSVHNGYLDIAASWGVQGLILFLAAIFLSWRSLRASISSLYASGNQKIAFLGCCLCAIIVSQLMMSMFGSSLKSEHFIWVIAMALAYRCALPEAATDDYEIEEVETRPEDLLNEEAPGEFAVT